MLDVQSGVKSWVLHDIRRSVSTLMAGELKINPHVADAVLAHKISDKVRGIYQRTDFIDERHVALSAWADWLGFGPDIYGDREVPSRRA